MRAEKETAHLQRALDRLLRHDADSRKVLELESGSVRGQPLRPERCQRRPAHARHIKDIDRISAGIDLHQSYLRAVRVERSVRRMRNRLPQDFGLARLSSNLGCLADPL